MEFDEPERLFKIWDYTVSHRTMVIRSDAEPSLGTTTRIEIYVTHVKTMLISTFLRGLRIRRASETELANVTTRFGVEASSDNLYLLESSSGNGFIVGGRPSWREAVREIDEPTLFDFSLPWPPGPEIKWGDVD
jgi:hypothetical protein